MYTKTQLMRSLQRGYRHEVFSHSTMGLFDITLMREALSVGRLPATRETVLLSSFYAAMCTMREVDYERVVTLPDESWQDDPGIFILVPDSDGSTSYLMADGHHRCVRRRLEGKEDMVFWMVPLEHAIRSQSGALSYLDWKGERPV